MKEEGGAAGSPLNVLVVDDEPNIRKPLSICLEAEGHRVTAASNFQDAVAREVPSPPAGEAEAPAPSVPKTPVLSHLLTPRRIVTWNQPVRKELALRTLVDAAVVDSGIGDPATILGIVRKREEEGSTFFNEGMVFPHARVEGMTRPVVAMGVTLQGVPDVSTEKPVECIFLVLSPAEAPDIQVRIVGILARVSRNRHLLLKIRSCRAPEEILAAIREWEAQRRSAWWNP